MPDQTNLTQLYGDTQNKLNSIKDPSIRRLVEYGFTHSAGRGWIAGLGDADAARVAQYMGVTVKDAQAFMNAGYTLVGGTPGDGIENFNKLDPRSLDKDPNNKRFQDFNDWYGKTLGRTWGDLSAAASSDQAKSAAGSAKAAVDQAAQLKASQRGNIQKQLQDFASMLSQPTTDAKGNITDPVLKQLAAVGGSQGQLAASSRGIQGGAQTAQGQAMAMANGLPYLQNRQQAYGQALGALSNNQTSNEQLDNQSQSIQNQYALGLGNLQIQQAGFNNDVAQSKYNADKAAAQAQGAMWGQALGTVADAYFPEYTKGQGGKLGTSLGGSIGGSTVAPASLSTVGSSGSGT